MLPTGRTEGMFVNVKPELKKIIDDKRKKEYFNLSEWFEEKFTMDFLPSIDKLEEERKLHLELANTCEKRIADLQVRDDLEKRLILNEKQIRQLVIACDGKFSIKRQWGLFCAATKKQYDLKEFIKLKEKYLDKLYL